jgi:hypothetical protein
MSAQKLALPAGDHHVVGWLAPSCVFPRCAWGEARTAAAAGGNQPLPPAFSLAFGLLLLGRRSALAFGLHLRGRRSGIGVVVGTADSGCGGSDPHLRGRCARRGGQALRRSRVRIGRLPLRGNRTLLYYLISYRRPSGHRGSGHCVGNGLVCTHLKRERDAQDMPSQLCALSNRVLRLPRWLRERTVGRRRRSRVRNRYHGSRCPLILTVSSTSSHVCFGQAPVLPYSAGLDRADPGLQKVVLRRKECEFARQVGIVANIFDGQRVFFPPGVRTAWPEPWTNATQLVSDATSLLTALNNLSRSIASGQATQKRVDSVMLPCGRHI